MPNLFIIESRNIYKGLFIELKKIGGRIEPHQTEWLDRLNARGYKAVCCYGYPATAKEIDWYLSGGK